MDSSYLLPSPKRLPLTIHRGEGCFVFDGDGRRYLDLVSGLGVNALGYSHPRITAVMVEQMSLCVHTSGLYSHPYQELLARELSRIAGLDRALFTNSGTEATEAALKLARCYGSGRDKTVVVALEGSFHGRTRGALAVNGQESFRAPFAPYGMDVTFVAPNDEDGLAAAANERTAALIVEPVQGEGGVRPLSGSFLQAARELTRRNEALLIADECQSGLGRTGAMFGYQWSGIQPDIVTVAKPIGGGLPLGAVMFSEVVAASFPAGTHATTCGGGPLACRVGLEFLTVLQELMPHVREVGDYLRAGLERLRSRHCMIREVRGCGLMLGMELDRAGAPFVRAALDRGVLINCTQENVLRLLPPYVLSLEEAEEGLRVLEEVMAGGALR